MKQIHVIDCHIFCTTAPRWGPPHPGCECTCRFRHAS